MASETTPGQLRTQDNGPHIEQDSDPPQLPVIVPNSVQGSVSPSEPLPGEVPAVVSITRVPAKPKVPETPVMGGLKVRTDLSAPKPGPPPLLRVAGGSASPRPALPPMPKLKLGGQRGGGPGGPRFPVNGMMNMMKGQNSGLLNIPTPAMPSISNSLRHLRPKPPVQVPPASARTPKQFSTFLPTSVSSLPSPPVRPVQVRTVFVPPPMKMSGKSPGHSSGPKVINSFNMSSSRSLSGISITPVNKSNSNGIAPVIKGVNAVKDGEAEESVETVNGQSPPKHFEDESYDDLELELDEDDEGLESVKDNNELLSEPSESHPIITSVTSLRRSSSESASPDLSNQKAKKSFKSHQEKLSITISPKQSAITSPPVKRSLDTSDKSSSQDLTKKARLEPGNILHKTLSKPISAPSSVERTLSLSKSILPTTAEKPLTKSILTSTAAEKPPSRSILTSTAGEKPLSKSITSSTSFLPTTAEKPVSKSITSSTAEKPPSKSILASTAAEKPLTKSILSSTPSEKPLLSVSPLSKPDQSPVTAEKPRPVPGLAPVTSRKLCYCEAEPLKEASEGTEYICQAVENVGGHRVGCKNKVTKLEVVRLMARDSTLLATLGLLCDLHRARAESHGLCPLCGEFCSHGLVFMCRASKTSEPHLFHRHCYQSKARETGRVCPHCGSKRSPLAVQLKMTMSRTPLRLLNYTAKMTATKDKELMKMLEARSESRENIVNYTLPSGKVISADGVPKGLEQNRLDEVIKNFNSKSNAKCTTRNMFHPTAAGDNVKLMQLLAMDYSPNQKFPEADGGSPLHVAAGKDHVLTAHILLQAGADIDAFDDNNETPLMIAAYNGFPNVVRYLITAGASLGLKSDDGMTALHLAAQNGHLESCHIILGSNTRPKNHINVKDDGGWTPLVWACEHKHEAVIRYLLEQGADVFATDVEMNIALHWAAFSGSKDIVELLLSAGSNVNQANAIGETPLHIALRQDHYECALYLITRGSRLDVANNQGHLPANCIDEEKSKAASLIQLGTTLQRLMKGRKTKYLSEKTVSLDISNGKESLPITAINGEDLDSGPSGYVYVKNNVITNPLPIERNIAKLEHCKCRDNCSNEETCKCSDMSVRSWYDSNSVLKEGFDFTEPPMIFECNDMCSCNVNSCNNRVVQHGITARMQVYKTYGMGWGVRSQVDIPKGGFVCEYVGELISDAEAEQRENDSYLFDLENRDGDTFCIDANKFGNVTRFINHSCDPNLVPVKVFTSHQDLRFPHIAMFASREIKKGDILGFDYGEKFWVIKHKFFTCWCGLDKCKYSKQAIGRTLDTYYKKNPEEVTKTQEEESHKQTGKLKLKLKMEEGKVVKVDDSLLLPDEKTKTRGKSQEKREKSQEKKNMDKKSLDKRNVEKKNLENGVGSRRQRVVNGVGPKRTGSTKDLQRDEIESSDSDVSKKSSKKKEKSVEKEKAIIDLEEKITQIKGKILQISENKKIEKSDKTAPVSKSQLEKEKSVSGNIVDKGPLTSPSRSQIEKEKIVDQVIDNIIDKHPPSPSSKKTSEKEEVLEKVKDTNASLSSTESHPNMINNNPEKTEKISEDTEKPEKVADKPLDDSGDNPPSSATTKDDKEQGEKEEKCPEQVEETPSLSPVEEDMSCKSPAAEKVVTELESVEPSSLSDSLKDLSTDGPEVREKFLDTDMEIVDKLIKNGSTSDVHDEISREITDKILDKVMEKEASVESEVSLTDLLASDTETETRDSKYYCSNCPASFDRDDKMLFHQEECIRTSRPAPTPPTPVKAAANQCPKCLVVINKKGKLMRHSRLCKGKKSAASTPTPPEGRSEKKLSITNIDEAIVDNVIDATNLEDRESKNGTDTPSSTQSPVPSEPSDDGVKRGRGRPKKPSLDVNNVLDRITPTVNLKRVSSTSLRSSASNLTSESNSSDQSSENAGINSRPKRSRKTVDKDL